MSGLHPQPEAFAEAKETAQAQTGNGITRYGNGAYALVGGVAELLQLCRQRVRETRFSES
jgi:hypothetical protein